MGRTKLFEDFLVLLLLLGLVVVGVYLIGGFLEGAFAPLSKTLTALELRQ